MNLTLANIVLGLVLILLSIIYYYLTWNYSYWKKRKIPYVKPSLAFGSIKDATLLKKSFCDVFSETYKRFDKYKYVGFFLWRKPALLIRDPEIINMVLTKNFSNFKNNAWYVNKKHDPYFSKNPFIATGSEWKFYRNQVAPGLTSGKMKLMFPQIQKASQSLVKYIRENEIEGKKDTPLQNLCLKFTTEAVSLGAFGIEANAFEKSKSDIFQLTEHLFERSALSSIYSLLMMCDKNLTSLFRIQVLTPEIANFFKGIINDIRNYREKNSVVLNDYFDFLLKQHEKNEKVYNDDPLVVHSMTLFFDGVGTTAISLSTLIFEVVKNLHVFKKLRHEIDTILEKFDGKLSSEAIQEMWYLDACVSEALRLYAPVFFTVRNCNEAIEFPNPKDDTGPKLVVEPGVTILIPTFAIHHDPNNFPDPEVYDPERFSKERKASIKKYTYLPFNDGPRICIGRNFAILEMKIALVEIVRNFDVTLSPDNKSSTLTPDVGATMSLFMIKENHCVNFTERGVIYKNMY